MPVNIGQQTIVQNSELGLVSIVIDNLFPGGDKTMTINYYVGADAKSGEKKSIVYNGDMFTTVFNELAPLQFLDLPLKFYDMLCQAEGITNTLTVQTASQDFINVPTVDVLKGQSSITNSVVTP